MENYKGKVTKCELKFEGNAFDLQNHEGKNIGVYSGFVCGDLNAYKEVQLYSKSKDELIANATLIAESFDVLQDSGYTPSELLAQRNELLEALKEVEEFLGHIQPKVGKIAFDTIYEVVEQAITNATK